MWINRPRLTTATIRLLAAALSLFIPSLAAGVEVVTQHNDMSRTGQNLTETILNTSNVNVNSFGKLFSRTVDGQIYAQPLYLPNLTIQGGVHNVVFVATMHNSVYAFDADAPSASAPLWQVNLGTPVPSKDISSSYNDISPEIGILSTPVIDSTGKTMYVVAKTKNVVNSTYHFQLHALDILTGAEKFGGPSEITAQVAGSGDGSIGGQVLLDQLHHINRPGLLLLNGVVYFAFGSLGDIFPYHGWVLGYNASTLLPVGIFNSTPNGSEGAIWQAANGLMGDAAGYIYLMTGNGTFNANTNGTEYGDSILKLQISPTLSVLDYFTPDNQSSLNSLDLDLGSAGPIMLPGTNYLVGIGKDGIMRLVNTMSMGKFNPSVNNDVQEFQVTAGGYPVMINPIYWNSPNNGPEIFIWGPNDVLKAFKFNVASALFQTTPVSQGSISEFGGASNSVPLSLSANGSQAGTGIVWASAAFSQDANQQTVAGILRAFDATNLSVELWNSRQNLARDDVGNYAKFSPATVANGKVYLATFSGQLQVYGLLGFNVSTASLASGVLGSAYSQTLTASGGQTPYTWSISSGNLPAGLTLAPLTGAISGTPTTAGTFNFTVQATDSSSPVQIATKALSIIIAAQATYTIWSGSTVPGTVDSGPDSAVELGVKFRADSSGFITGIRFYKASTNTGTHIGNLWTTSGTRLATATFSGETASGWQQVNFSTPVAITANTVYVASYHTNTGHYSDDQNYFASKGMDSPPLHALANGVSSFDGVYAYGSASSFPTLGWNSSNYWVDVSFNTTAPAPPTLSSIAVTPVNPTIQSGTTQQFTATGTYSDGSTQNLTSQTSWASSNTGIATINSTGLATAANAGSTTISATLNAILGSTSLTVTVPTLTITTASLPGGAPNVSYSAALTAVGGKPPVTWSLFSGSLPTGLSLSGTGTISGTPTLVGTFSFTVQATDSGSPGQIATKGLSIVIAAQASYTIWSATTVPGTVDSGPDSAVELGVKFRADSSGFITGIRFYKASTNTGTHIGNLWSISGTRLATATFAGETASGWQQVNFSTPVAITANTVYVASYHTNTGHYSDDQNYFAGKGMDSPPLHALANGVSSFDGVYAYGSASSFPTLGWNSSNYWVDVVFHP